MIRPGSLSTESEAVTLRRLTVDDVQEYFDVINENREHLSQFGEPIASDRPDLNAIKDLIEYSDPKNKWQLAIRKDESLIGMVNLTPTNKTATIDYWLTESEQGKGYATHAVSALAEFASREFYSVQAFVKSENDRSMHVLVRSGFIKAAIFSTDQGIFKLFRYSRHQESEQSEE